MSDGGSACRRAPGARGAAAARGASRVRARAARGARRALRAGARRVPLPRGRRGDRVFISERGRLEAVDAAARRRASSRSLPLGPGELIGEMAALARLPRQWSVRAIEPATGWALRGEAWSARCSASVTARRLGRASRPARRGAAARRSTPASPTSSRRDDRIAEPARPSSLDLAGPVLAGRARGGRDRLPVDDPVLQRLRPRGDRASSSAGCGACMPRAGRR